MTKNSPELQNVACDTKQKTVSSQNVAGKFFCKENKNYLDNDTMRIIQYYKTTFILQM